ncbi:MAG TPA: DoxX family protein [Vicinamibacterales bacterium]|nr:DoxX family protein [Vicinamibacterales bacterium]
MDAGLLLARLVFGLLMAGHGAQKVFGWFGGYGLAGTGGFFESLGFKPGRWFAAAAGGTELVAGLLLAAGLLGPLGPALILAVMIVAMATVHWAHGLFADKNGIEVPLLYATAATAIALSGHGAYSADALLGLSWSAPVIWSALAAGAIGGLANLAIRKTDRVAVHV